MMRLTTVAACVWCLSACSSLLAQNQEVPPAVPDRPWIPVVFGIVLFLGAVAVSVMTPRRTHQD